MMLSALQRLDKYTISLICGYATPQTQATLARTCRFFSESALNALWKERSLPNLFLSVLPHNTVRLTEKDGYLVMELNPDRNVPDDDQWCRVAMYGVRIKSTATSGEGPDALAVHFSEDILSLWSSYTQRRGMSRAFCPRATELHWNIRDPQSMGRETPFILSNVLVRLTVSDHVPAHLRSAFVATLPALAIPTLKRLSIKNNNRDEAIQLDPAVSSLVRSCPALERVSLHHASGACMHALSELTALRSVEVSTLMNISCRADGGPYFPALIDFSGMANLRDVLPLIGMLKHAQSLQKLNIFYLMLSEGHPERYFSLLVAAVVRGCGAKQLSNLSLGDYTPQDNLYSLALNHIRPLLVFSRLETLFLTWPGYADFSDYQMHTIAKALPLLKSLRMIPRVGMTPNDQSTAESLTPPAIRITPESLLSLASHCPRLEHLAMPLNASPLLTSLEAHPGRGIVQGRLRNLSLVGPDGDALSQPPTMVSLALFLSDVFPNLRLIQAQNAPSSFASSISGMLHVMALVRDRERRGQLHVMHFI
ncbi:uncharacterized protein SCHCODRAFT_02539751 [Schizophyllum commune H4-8]|nr:uncharacterized protein SCHCODRAFT_02539751 [Schizophyllum commune H4-8]KAI5893924.1 hypothetical protein SCHCODRAFT_02539751 [Schizophyllum commune H4-8]